MLCCCVAVRVCVVTPKQSAAYWRIVVRVWSLTMIYACIRCALLFMRHHWNPVNSMPSCLKVASLVTKQPAVCCCSRVILPGSWWSAAERWSVWSLKMTCSASLCCDHNVCATVWSLNVVYSVMRCSCVWSLKSKLRCPCGHWKRGLQHTAVFMCVVSESGLQHTAVFMFAVTESGL